MIRRNAVQHRALFLHPLAVIVDLAGNSRDDYVALLAHGMIEALRDGGIVEAEIARQCRRRAA